SHRARDLVELLAVLGVQDRSVELSVTHGGKLLVLRLASALELRAAWALESELLGALVHRQKTSDNADPLLSTGRKPMPPHAGAMPRVGGDGCRVGIRDRNVSGDHRTGDGKPTVWGENPQVSPGIPAVSRRRAD